MSEISPNLSLPLIQAAQAQKYVTHSEAIELLDMIVHLTVQGFTAETPPALALEGQSWALGASPTGAWAGQAGNIASWRGGGWLFVTPVVGWQAWGVSEAKLRVYTSSGWQDVAPETVLENLTGVGINTTSDATNRLALAGDATLLTHDGAGHQLKLNKATAGDTASLLYQTNWSGRAEMGLTGTDDFSIKTSPDGSTFHDGIVVSKDNGKVSFPNGTAGSGSTAGALGLQAMGFAGERDTGFDVGHLLSYGNGATLTAGPVMPFAGKVFAATISIAAGTVGTNTLDIAINKTGIATHQVSLNVVSGADLQTATAAFSASPLSFAAGDALSMKVSASSDTSHNVVGPTSSFSTDLLAVHTPPQPPQECFLGPRQFLAARGHPESAPLGLQGINIPPRGHHARRIQRLCIKGRQPLPR